MPSKIKSVKKTVSSTENTLDFKKSAPYRELGDRISVKGTNVSRFSNITSDTTIKDGFNRTDWEDFRADEAIPKLPKDVMAACMNVPRKIGLIGNIINLMSDFTVQGIKIVHPKPSNQKLYNEWWDIVNGKRISERFVNIIYRAGVCAISRQEAKLRDEDVKKLRKGQLKSKAAVQPLKFEQNKIPWSYKFINPLTLEVIGEELATFVDSYDYAVRISPTLVKKVTKPRTQSDIDLVARLPNATIDFIKNGNTLLPLDKNKTSIFFYKKDDWEVWPSPMLEPILPDLIHLEKIRLADMVALDGAIRSIRLWKIGDLEHKVPPSKEQMNKLANVLAGQTAGGSIDLIWGPAIDFKESSTNLYEFLGSEKYEPILNAIYAGLGIPPSLTGTAGSTFSNSYISLQTLLERLSYVRDLLIDFWNKEIKMFQLAMGLSTPAFVEFDKATLADPASEKALLIQLADRGLISQETIQMRFGENPEVEKARTKREWIHADEGKIPPKAGPWHNPQTKEELTKIGFQTGQIGGDQLGLDNVDEFNPLPSAKNSGQPQQGRPNNSKDKNGRKKRVDTPRKSVKAVAANIAWAKSQQSRISELLDPIWLEIYHKKNARMLSDKESSELEEYKFAVLCAMDPDEPEWTDEEIVHAYNQELKIPNVVRELCNETLSVYQAKYNKPMTLKEIRDLRLTIYSTYKEA